MKVRSVLLADDVITGMESIGDAECILVARRELSQIHPETAKRLIACITEANLDAAVLYAVSDDPTGYARILRNEYGEIKGIVRERDATEQQRGIREISASAYCFHRDLLLFALDSLDRNELGGYCLADVISIISNMGGKVMGVECSREECLV